MKKLKKLKSQEKKIMFSPGIEPGTFRVLGGCDNHYTTKTSYKMSYIFGKKTKLYYMHFQIKV